MYKKQHVCSVNINDVSIKIVKEIIDDTPLYSVIYKDEFNFDQPIKEDTYATYLEARSKMQNYLDSIDVNC